MPRGPHCTAPALPLTGVSRRTEADDVVGLLVGVAGAPMVVPCAGVAGTGAGPALLPRAQHWVAVVPVLTPARMRGECHGVHHIPSHHPISSMPCHAMLCHHIPSHYPISFHHILSHPIMSIPSHHIHPIPSHHIPSHCPIISHCILSHPIVSMPSHLIPSYACHAMPSHPISSHQAHLSQCRPAVWSRQRRQLPVWGSHSSVCPLHWQGRQAGKPQWPGWHWSHCRPTAPGWQRHCPLTASHNCDTEPSGEQAQAAAWHGSGQAHGYRDRQTDGGPGRAQRTGYGTGGLIWTHRWADRRADGQMSECKAGQCPCQAGAWGLHGWMDGWKDRWTEGELGPNPQAAGQQG